MGCGKHSGSVMIHVPTSVVVRLRLGLREHGQSSLPLQLGIIRPILGLTSPFCLYFWLDFTPWPIYVLETSPLHTNISIHATRVMRCPWPRKSVAPSSLSPYEYVSMSGWEAAAVPPRGCKSRSSCPGSRACCPCPPGSCKSSQTPRSRGVPSRPSRQPRPRPCRAASTVAAFPSLAR